MAVGNHTIVELWGADAKKLNDEGLLRRGMIEAAEAGKLVVLEEVFHSFEGQGVTGMLLLSSSHLTCVCLACSVQPERSDA
jgi:S-adenosylmethionine decarboxylase